ncbi:MAG: hypothetical protein [Caudoviricetes sp.]|nr:MAG: hypothetical protein [Caudoviricetes sp.]
MSNPEILTYIPFAVNGEKNTIQVYRQANQDQEDATFSEGWPKITMIPLSSGGIPPKGLDINGVLYQLSLDTVHRQSGKQMQFDATYASNIKGYSKGAMLQSTDLTRIYLNTVDGNLTDPDSSSASGWNVYAQTPTATSTTTGTVKIADNLTSNATDTALTANQGRLLANMLSGVYGSNGTQQIGNSILAWGSALITSRVTADPSATTTVAFPKPFPNNCFQVIACHDDPIGTNAIFSVGGITKNGFIASSYKIQANGNGNALTAIKGSATMRYFAIGN